jgi:hypothetical protein
LVGQRREAKARCRAAGGQIPRLATLGSKSNLVAGTAGKRSVQPARASSNAAILIVAKLEKVSEIA